MSFLTTLIEGMTAQQKGGLIALLGGLLLGCFGLAAISDANVHISSDGIDFKTHDGICGSSSISLPDGDKHIE